MDYREYKPNRHLSRYIECFWSAYAERPPFRDRESLIPDGTIELMFNFGDDYDQFLSNRKVPVKGSHIIGIRKHALVISQTKRQDFFCIRFKPGGTYPFFKIPVHLFSNNFYSLQEIFGNEFRELEEQLYEAKDNDERIRLTEKFLMYLLQSGAGDKYRFVNVCTRHLLSEETAGINGLARRFNTNYKALERKFNDVIGLTPSELLGINRFNNAVMTLYSCKYDSMTGVAYACGYYDQSHFIREFRRLTGYTPGEFLKKQFTIVQVIQPALAERLSKSYNF